MEGIIDTVYGWLTTSGLKIVGAILIFIVGRIVAGLLRGVVRRALGRSNTDPSLVSFFGTLTYVLVMVFTVAAILAKFGIQTASFVAVLGAAAFAIGFALQGSLSNFAAGVMLLTFRPFRVGNYIEGAGIAGTVKEIQLINTILATPDNVQIVVPNAKIYSDIIKNYSAYDTRRLDLVVGIGYGASIQAASDTIAGLVKADERVLAEPEFMIAVNELADSSVNLVVRFWVNSTDYWPAKFDFQRKIKEALDEQGIEIPFPQRVVHMLK
ncbi:MAG: mechanosensitive ion channel [Candidatus Eisenbacteria bacterium]|nr:mechanosensitive ion channel [Candidatus Eisenbacteria bacterium]